jgi:hypothetical protein
MDPPARNSMWRFGFGTPINYRLVFVRSTHSAASKYDDILFVELRVQYKKSSLHCFCFDIQNNFTELYISGSPAP